MPCRCQRGSARWRVARKIGPAKSPVVAKVRTHVWEYGQAYAGLNRVERNLFAWEWLRRTVAYRRAWLLAQGQRTVSGQAAARFGLVALEDPRRDARRARPIWCADCDRRVVSAQIVGGLLPLSERFDIRGIMREAHVAVDADDNEHWRIGDATFSVRLDVFDGTLLGGPSQLSYRLSGLREALPRTVGLQRLVALATGRPALVRAAASQRARWIAELRVADAIRAGASHQEIGRRLFHIALDRGDWRRGNEAYRTRVQRLVRAARRRLRDPLSTDWFR